MKQTEYNYQGHISKEVDSPFHQVHYFYNSEFLTRDEFREVRKKLNTIYLGNRISSARDIMPWYLIHGGAINIINSEYPAARCLSAFHEDLEGLRGLLFLFSLRYRLEDLSQSSPLCTDKKSAFLKNIIGDGTLI